jgi:ferric-dicitrate binding protein FerR (iron transport regulator)
MSAEERERMARLRARWLRHLAGESTGDSELAGEIGSDSPLGQALLADEDLHRMLDAVGRSSADEAAFVEQVGRLVAAEASVEGFVSAMQRRLDAAARPVAPPRRRWPLLVAPAALLAAAAVALWPGGPAPRQVPAALGPAPAVATLVAGTLRSGFGLLRPGQPLTEGATLSSDEGRACLRLADGSQVCLERGTRMRVQTGRGDGPIALQAGKVAATVRHQEPGATFTIRTTLGDVTALGTAFSVELTDDGASMITRVVQGKVAIVPRGRPGSGQLLLRAHEALSASSGSRWRMSSEEERDEWALVRAQSAPAFLALQAEESPPPGPEEHEEQVAPAGAEVPALLRLADALRARGRLRDAQGICEGLARRYPGRPEIERVAAELRRPPPAQPWNATPAVYRINAGGSRYVDPRGNLWSADVHYSGGHGGEFQEEIDGTDMDPLYRSERFVFPGGQLSYNLPLADGRYVVRLHFAEIWAGTVKRNMRQFDVMVEGEKVLAGYDIAAEVGPMTATVKQVVTTVQDGSLDIDFLHVLENPKISAIEVFALAADAPAPPEPAPPTVFPPLPVPPTDALYRVNAGGREYVDTQGRRWEPDNYFNDTGLGAAQYVEIAGTDLDPLYQTERRAFMLPTRRPLVYSFPVPPGRYLLRLHFAELDTAPAAGRAVFDVLVEKAEALRGLDVFAEVGALTALVKEVETTVTDGALDLSFRVIAGRPRIAAIEVLPQVTAPPAAPGAGCSAGGAAPAAASPVWLIAFALALAGLAQRRPKGLTPG